MLQVLVSVHIKRKPCTPKHVKGRKINKVSQQEKQISPNDLDNKVENEANTITRTT